MSLEKSIPSHKVTFNVTTDYGNAGNDNGNSLLSYLASIEFGAFVAMLQLIAFVVLRKKYGKVG